MALHTSFNRMTIVISKVNSHLQSVTLAGTLEGFLKFVSFCSYFSLLHVLLCNLLFVIAIIITVRFFKGLVSTC